MPFIRTTLLKDLALMIDNDALDLRLNLETFRNASETIDNGFQCLLADRSRLGFIAVFRLKNRSRFSELRFLAGPASFDGINFIARHFEAQTELGFNRCGVVFAQRSRLEQLTPVKLRHRWALLDFCVQIRLSE